jgi:hypothetical protein
MWSRSAFRKLLACAPLSRCPNWHEAGRVGSFVRWSLDCARLVRRVRASPRRYLLGRFFRRALQLGCTKRRHARRHAGRHALDCRSGTRRVARDRGAAAGKSAGVPHPQPPWVVALARSARAICKSGWRQRRAGTAAVLTACSSRGGFRRLGYSLNTSCLALVLQGRRRSDGAGGAVGPTHLTWARTSLHCGHVQLLCRCTVS